MDPDDLRNLVEVTPSHALVFHTEQLTAAQFDYCIRKEPQAALMFDGPSESLSVSQFEFCGRLYPNFALSHSNRLSPELLDFCCEREPSMVLRKFGAETPGLALTKTQLAICARAAPLAALEFAGDELDETLFNECADAEPWGAVTWCADRLTADELVRHTKGRDAELNELLAYPSARPLIFKLMPLFGRLDPAVEKVVAHAIAAGM
ncbi:MAG: hypothetical protein H7Y36_09835 [Armatimonadetes bacterium]|nr:hypothetical protein [Akkermansiaceae bacterium]